MNLIKRAAIGTEDAASLLLEAGKLSLMRRAGKIPQATEDKVFLNTWRLPHRY